MVFTLLREVGPRVNQFELSSSPQFGGEDIVFFALGDLKIKYFFGTYEIENSDLTPTEVKKIWSSVHPEIENAAAEEREDGIHFIKRSGSKG